MFVFRVPTPLRYIIYHFHLINCTLFSKAALPVLPAAVDLTKSAIHWNAKWWWLNDCDFSATTQCPAYSVVANNSLSCNSSQLCCQFPIHYTPLYFLLSFHFSNLLLLVQCELNLRFGATEIDVWNIFHSVIFFFFLEIDYYLKWSEI